MDVFEMMTSPADRLEDMLDRAHEELHQQAEGDCNQEPVERVRELELMIAPSCVDASIRSLELKNSDELKVQHHNLRDRQGGDLTVDQWVSLRLAFNKKCAYCGKWSFLVIEHMRPLSRGGRTTLSNVVPSCRHCNAVKWTRTPKEWLGESEYRSFQRRLRESRKRMRGLRTRNPRA